MKNGKHRFLQICTVLVLMLTAAALCLMHVRRSLSAGTVRLESAETRGAWLNLHGWHVGEPTDSEVRLPDTWQTAAGQRWLQIQQSQGLDPERYAGKQAVRYVYPVEQGSSPYQRAELILCGSELVGAEIYDAATQLMQPVY